MDVPKSMLTHVGHLIWLTECFISLVKRVKQGHQDVDDDSEVESYARPSEHLTSNGILDSLCCGGEGKEGDKKLKKNGGGGSNGKRVGGKRSRRDGRRKVGEGIHRLKGTLSYI